jgi:hypothetical protein
MGKGKKATKAVPSKDDKSAAPASHFFSLTSPGNNSYVHISCLVLLIVIIYSNTLNAPFQWDEYEYLVSNPIVKDLHYFVSPSVAQGFKYYNFLMLRYVGYLTFALNYKIHGFSVAGYHIVNIAIHIANSILVYLLVLLTFRTPFFAWRSHPSPMTYDRQIAFFSAALFAVHPLQTDAVTYIYKRFVPLASFFYLFSLTAYIKARLALTTERIEKKTTNFLQNQKVSPWYILSLLSAILAMKTKEIAFTLPLVVTLYEFCFFPVPGGPATAGALKAPWPHHTFSRSQRFFYLVPMLLTMSIIPLTLIWLKGTAGGGAHPLPGSYGSVVLSRGEYMFTEFRVIVTYLRLLFMPVNQNINYDYPVFKFFFDPQVTLSFLFLSALFAFGVYMIIGKEQRGTGKDRRGTGKDRRGTGKDRRTKSEGIRAASEDRRGAGKDRRTKSERQRAENKKYMETAELGTVNLMPCAQCSMPYAFPDLRLIGFGILWFFITLSVESIIPVDRLIDEYRVYLPSAGVSIAVVTGVFLLINSPSKRGAGVGPRLLLAVLALAIVGLSVATYLRNELWTDEISLWEDTARKSPAKATVHFGLGDAYRDHNMIDKAMEQYLIAVKLNPGLVDAHYNLGIIYQLYNLQDKAIEQYQIAIKLDPDSADAHYNLGSVYYHTGQMENARREIISVLNISPNDQQARKFLKEISPDPPSSGSNSVFSPKLRR